MKKKRRKRPTPIPPGSGLEDTFARLWPVYAGTLPVPIRGYLFDPPRRSHLDFAWPEFWVAVEIHGGLWIRGRHQRPGGYQTDCRKWNRAARLGWRVFHYTTADMTERPVQTVEEAVEFLRLVVRDTTDPTGEDP